MIVDTSSSCLDAEESAGNLEVRGDVEGELLLEWFGDLGLLAIHSWRPSF